MTSDQFVTYVNKMAIHEVQKRRLLRNFEKTKNTMLSDKEIHTAISVLMKLDVFIKYLPAKRLSGYVKTEIERYRDLMISRKNPKYEEISEM